MIASAALHAACLAVFRSSLLHIPAYAVISIAGILAVLWLSLRTAPLRGISPDTLWDAGFFAVVSAFVISRLTGFLLLLAIEHGHLTLSVREVLSFSSISYLSLLITAVVVAVWLRWKHLPLLPVVDAWAPCAALLSSALSFAEAAAGSLNGLPTHVPWGIRAASGLRSQPVALYSAACALALCAVLFAMLRRVRTPGRVAAVALIAAGVLAFLLDMLRLPEQPLANNLLDTSQWLALLGIVVGGCLFAFVPRAGHQEVR